MREKFFEQGTEIFREGDAGSEAFRILEGRIEISMRVAGQSKVTLGHLVPGDIFGEMALLDDNSTTSFSPTPAPSPRFYPPFLSASETPTNSFAGNWKDAKCRTPKSTNCSSMGSPSPTRNQALFPKSF
ncbi:MAG: cyclic nucleotide-binding domain-containing protein [Verrucomicrobia bacterium]|nr:cyclic nucleotide-binding domain-containing protein [Verrucomicrobiota bacterium]